MEWVREKEQTTKDKFIWTKEKGLAAFSTMCYILVLIASITKWFGEDNHAKTRLILLQSLGCMLIPLAFAFIDHFFNLKLSFGMKLGIILFGMFNSILGEACEFYYYFAWWDDLLHTVSGFGVCWFGFDLVYYLIKDKQFAHPVVISILGGIMISLSMAMIWEIYEFTFDSLFGTNMQKTIPEMEGLFNGGDVNAPLNGSDEVLSSFYRESAGYRYALMDTMGDILCCFTGTFGFVLMALVLKRAHRTELLNQCIVCPNHLK